MGAWGLLFDENDDAGDWLDEFERSPTWSLVDAAFDLEEDYVEADEASSALAAIEIVAAAKGNASARLPDAIRRWASDQKAQGETRSEKAAQVAIRVRDDSELSELWEESEEFEDWKKSIDETISRL